MCYGLCFWDSSGHLLFGKSDLKLLSTTVLEAEAIGFLESLKMAISKDLRNVAFETDSKLLVDLLGNINPPLNEIGDFRNVKLSYFILSNPDYVVSFVRRQANSVAHNIARAALSNPSPHVFYNVPTSLYSICKWNAVSLPLLKKNYIKSIFFVTKLPSYFDAYFLPLSKHLFFTKLLLISFYLKVFLYFSVDLSSLKK